MRSHGGLHDNCSEALVKSVATEMIANGMRDAGYRRINLDDCWYRPSFAPAAAAANRRSGRADLRLAVGRGATNLEGNRADHGRYTWSPTRFPSGIPALVTWLHERGFLFGLCEWSPVAAPVVGQLRARTVAPPTARVVWGCGSLSLSLSLCLFVSLCYDRYGQWQCDLLQWWAAGVRGPFLVGAAPPAAARARCQKPPPAQRSQPKPAISLQQAGPLRAASPPPSSLPSRYSHEPLRWG
jgi:hypothetical protein